jgi:hypothetical protein
MHLLFIKVLNPPDEVPAFSFLIFRPQLPPFPITKGEANRRWVCLYAVAI